jgi:hypothetical protein
MRDFIDFHGASGAAYRFRLWPQGAPHLPMAGNYAVVREADEGFSLLSAGESNDLSLVRKDLKRLLNEHPIALVYTRLNVSRAVRAAENEDIVAHYKPRRAPTAAAARG